MRSDRRTNPFLGGTVNKRLQIIPRVNQGLENLHIVKVNRLEEIDKHLIRFTVHPLLCSKGIYIYICSINASFLITRLLNLMALINCKA
jgi:hypothetical protein